MPWPQIYLTKFLQTPSILNVRNWDNGSDKGIFITDRHSAGVLRIPHVHDYRFRQMNHLPPNRMLQEGHRGGEGDRARGALGGQIALVGSHGSRTNLVLAAVVVKDLRGLNPWAGMGVTLTLGADVVHLLGLLLAKLFYIFFLRMMATQVHFDFLPVFVAFSSHLIDLITTNF